MKKVLLILIIFSSLIVFSFYPPFTKLVKVETEHFIIYYEKEIENLIDPSYINFMEQSYTFLSNLFDHHFKNKIYVYFSNREKNANGFDNPAGQSTIYIITTPPELSSSIGYMDDWLKLVFYHELTHQFSLTIKSKLAEFLSYLFGNIFLSSSFNNPFFMVEGITTSFEGRENEIGRTYSPYIKQFIMQAIVDGNFKNPYELESSFDQWPYQSLGYWYGGFFSKFLQDTYGMDLYIKLWQKTAYLTFETALKQIYGKELLELWDEFYDWIKPKFEVYVNFEDCLKNSRKDILSNGRLVKIEEEIFYFYYNRDLKTIFKYNVETKKNEPLHKNIFNFNSFEVDSPGKYLILTYYDYKGSSLVIRNRIFDLEKKKFIKSSLDSFYDIREVNFFNDQFVAIDLSGSFTDLVLISKDKSKKVLIKGNRNLYISNPQQLDYSTIIFLASENGKRSLYTYDINENKIKKLDLNVNYIYDFNCFNGKIFFTYNNDYTFSKFAMIDDYNEIHLDKNFSGGFTDPYYIDGKIIYIGSFSNKSLLLSIDINLDSIEEAKILVLKDKNIDFVKVFKLDIFKNEKSSSIQSDENINSNQIDETNDTKTMSLDENSIILKKSISIFPFNENILPDFWIPLPSFYVQQNNLDYDFYYNGFGGVIFWLEPVTSSMTYFGAYIASLDPTLISFDLNSSLKYFYPWTINFFLGSYWLNSLKEKENNISHIFLSKINIYYDYINLISGDEHFFNLEIFYKNEFDKDFFSIYLEYDYNKFANSIFPYYFSNLLYYSNLGFSSNSFYKYEFESALSIKMLGINIIENLAYSFDSNLNFYGINEYYHTSLYDPLYELESLYPDAKFNFLNIINIKVTIFETRKMGILSILLPEGIFKLGLYFGYKNYIVSNLDLGKPDFNTIIQENIIYLNLALISYANILEIGFSASYIISMDKITYYFYYIIKNPYNLI